MSSSVFVISSTILWFLFGIHIHGESIKQRSPAACVKAADAIYNTVLLSPLSRTSMHIMFLVQVHGHGCVYTALCMCWHAC